jgi:peptide/nickel transport system permease protein
MGTLQDVTAIQRVVPSTPTRSHILFSAARYLAGKALTILATIFIGVFITVLVMNYPAGLPGETTYSPFESYLEGQIDSLLKIGIHNNIIPRDALGVPVQQEVAALEAKLRSEAGLDLPYLPRYLLWTVKALTFDWGELHTGFHPPLRLGQSFPAPTTNYVLEYLPNTLLLVGTAYLLVFLLGMPFSLYLARRHGGWLDQVMLMVSPLSSVPSWVFAVLLVTIFAVQLRWLPPAGMFDFHKPTEPIPYALALVRHMILPVSALVLSLLFQLVYTWRTFLILYSEEDYVELARAKGLEPRLLEKQYILRPALPYVLTSFVTSLIGFWQLTVVLERIFQWPGIGLLYIESLPNYWGETVQYGDLMIVIQIVVTFSYLLGILVFLLDLAYVLVDPRIHLIPQSNLARTSAQVRKKSRGRGLFDWRKGKDPSLAKPAATTTKERRFSRERFARNGRESLREAREQIRLFGQQLRIYPSAIFGLVVITLLLAGSLYAFIALPYEQIGTDFDQRRSTGRNLRPRTAAPAWSNLFSATPRLSTLILEEESSQTSTTLRTLENGWLEKTITFRFDYQYRDIPSDVFLYLDAIASEKRPFVSVQWTTPDGETIDLKSKAIDGDNNYDINEGLSVRRLLDDHPAWKDWFVTEGQYPTPPFVLLFAEPGSREPIPQRGIYQLKITSLLFEADSDLKPQLVLLGQVYGLAGTDYWRRDLIVPLFWGMPFTLLVGFIGTLITTLVALMLPAIGVWFGGWLDNVVQRLTEFNMVLPGLAIVMMINAVYGVHIWILLGIVVVLNALGGPIKSFRSAFLQAKEAPYIEMARSYGASDSRIITRYLIPRILPVIIPYLVMQIPTFIFLEATLGFFNIKSTYPTWGRIIYDGLARGALYGSPFWVLEPIFLLLLTGLAFAMLGLALERILNPRLISDMPVAANKLNQESGKAKDRRRNVIPIPLNKRVLAGLIVVLLALAIFTPAIQGKTLTSVFMSYFHLAQRPGAINPRMEFTNPPQPVTSSAPTRTPTVRNEPSSTRTATTTPSPAPTNTSGGTSTLTPAPAPARPVTYVLQRGEYPYCIARRFNVDPGELLVLNGMLNSQTFYTGSVLQIPQTGNPFPGERMQQIHPVTYTVSRTDETLHTIACPFGDVDPLALAQVNGISIDSPLYAGQQLNIP